MHSSFVGGGANEFVPWGFEVSQTGTVYLGGTTNAGDFPVQQPLQATVAGLQPDAFVMQVALDAVGDGWLDGEDNCTAVANADQRDSNRDSNGDGYGNACDADLNDDGTINFLDLGDMCAVFFSADADADLDGDGRVSFGDLAILRSSFFSAPGPCGLVSQ